MLENYKPHLIIASIICIIIAIFLSYTYLDKEEDEVYFGSNEEITTTISEYFYVDVKGAVNKPGVFEFKNGDRVIDAINKAEGVRKTGDTSNINLSKRLTSEMVVYIYTSKEIKDGTKNINCNTTCNCEIVDVNNCVENKNTKKININTASITELQTLSGIGESKAKDIIKYREDNGNFKDVEDLKNISGIGESVYEKIKDYVTI